MTKKILLTDIDGCVVKWNKAFDTFMTTLGFHKTPNETSYNMAKRYSDVPEDVVLDCLHLFNVSGHICNLEPLPDAVEYLNKFADDGYQIIGITSIGTHELTQHHRNVNINRNFHHVFSEVIHLETGSHKRDVLTHWKDSGCYWVEDFLPNAHDGHLLGLKPIVVTQPWNSDMEVEYPRVSPYNAWKSIYEIVTNGQ